MPSREGVLPAQVRILGLDPGSQRTGYAVIEVNGSRTAYLGYKAAIDRLAGGVMALLGVRLMTSTAST